MSHVNGQRPRRTKPDKSPAYQWYPRDAMSDGTMLAMTNEQEGLYRRFLDHAWLEDGLPPNPTQLFLWSKCDSRERFDQLWMTISPLFPTGTDGRLRNPRQEKERRKQKKNSRLKRLAARVRWKKTEELRAALADARASTAAVHVECLAFALALAPSDSDQKQEVQRDAVRRAPPLRMAKSVYDVRRHLTAAAHRYFETHPELAPTFVGLGDELKDVAVLLGATWTHSRELEVIADAALAQWNLQQANLRYRLRFDQRERRQLRGRR